MTIEADIAAIRDALAAGPTPGPWVSRGSLGPQSNPSLRGPCVIEQEGNGKSLAHMTGWRTGQQESDAAYISSVHPERIARLLDALEQATEARKAAQTENEAIKARMVRVRLDLMRELKELGWQAP